MAGAIMRDFTDLSHMFLHGVKLLLNLLLFQVLVFLMQLLWVPFRLLGDLKHSALI
jgi:hypothetical protein